MANEIQQPALAEVKRADIEAPYGKFFYTGDGPFENVSGQEPEPGINWFITSTVDTETTPIKIKKHLFEDNTFYLTGTGANYNNLHTIYSETNTLTATNLQSIPLITIVECGANEFIYAFNEPYRLSPYIVPGSLFQMDSKKAEFKKQIIAFEGITTKYTYIFYDVDFVTTEDKLPAGKSLWQLPGNITISDYATKLISKEINKDSNGKIILKAKNTFGIVVMTETFEVVDPLLLTPNIGKEVSITENIDGSQTVTPTGTGTAPTQTTSTGGCIDCINQAFPWKRTTGQNVMFNDMLFNDLTEKEPWYANANALMSNYKALDILENRYLCLSYFTPGAGKHTVDSYENLVNDNCAPYKPNKLTEITREMNNRNAAIQNVINGLQAKGIRATDLNNRTNINDIDERYSQLVNTYFPPK